MKPLATYYQLHMLQRACRGPITIEACPNGGGVQLELRGQRIDEFAAVIQVNLCLWIQIHGGKCIGVLGHVMVRNSRVPKRQINAGSGSSKPGKFASKYVL